MHRQNIQTEKKEIFVAAIAFRKAFGFINREKLTEAVMYYKVDSKIIECIKETYKDDRTIIDTGKGNVVQITVRNGIRQQGCHGSTTLLKLIAFMILNGLEETEDGYQAERIKINTMVFADDGLQMSKSLEEAKRNVRKVTDISKEWRLEISKDKSNFTVQCRREYKRIGRDKRS